MDKMLYVRVEWPESQDWMEGTEEESVWLTDGKLYYCEDGGIFVEQSLYNSRQPAKTGI